MHTMEMKSYTNLILCLFWIMPAFSQAPPSLSKKEMKELSRVFEGELAVGAISLSSYSATDHGELKEGDRVYWIDREGDRVGYILCSAAKGRYDYFDYDVFYSVDLHVKGVIVTVYRSTNGAAICQRKWLSQFNDYAGEKLTLGKDIDAISGATLSAQSLVLDMQRCHALITGLRREGMIQ